MLAKIKTTISKIKPFHLLIIILITGLSYGAFSFYMKIAKFSKMSTMTKSVSVKVSHIKLGVAQKINSECESAISLWPSVSLAKTVTPANRY